MSNVAAGVTVTLLAQLGLKRWVDIRLGWGAIDSSEPALHAAYEAAHGILRRRVRVALAVRRQHHDCPGEPVREVRAARLAADLGGFFLGLLFPV
ncbi:MAG: hypothetical protein ACXVXW_14485 [Mycobacteriaceae bacterium]